MNTNILRKFAQETRKRLLATVSDKLSYVLSSDSAKLRDDEKAIQTLRKDLEKEGREGLIDKVAYTWFNRLMALRFMDVHDYQPLGLRVLSPRSGFTQPEILEEAVQGRIPEELKIEAQHIYDLLDGRIPASNPQNEVYRILLIASCNHLHTLFPFLFEKLKDYTELLLPDDLISELSIVQDFVKGMSEEDCAETEVIGWLYQFYISERKDEVFAAKDSVKKEDIPAATQLFTPRWIVEYMVQNTLGKLWLQNRPHSSLKQYMPYYIDSPVAQSQDFLKINSAEEITFLDQASGSGHILVYAFELLSKIYEEEGYTPSEIPQLILEKNLFGFEIDDRAAQLAGLSLMMKARMYQRRAFRKNIQPQILCYQDLKLEKDEISAALKQVGVVPEEALLQDLKTMHDTKNLGSLIAPEAKRESIVTALEKIQQHHTTDAFLKHHLTEIAGALSQLELLSRKYHCIVQNPPYMGGGKMNKALSDFVKVKYPDSKADLFSCFIELSIVRTQCKGLIGNVTMESWMFLSSFEKFRKNLLDTVTIDSLSHFGWHIMRIAFGTVSFILRNIGPKEEDLGVYNYLEIGDIDRNAERPFRFPNKKRRYSIRNQKDFEKIPGNNIGYWLSKNLLLAFNSKNVNDYASPRKGMVTSNNERFIRDWNEVQRKDFILNKRNRREAESSGKKWFPYHKGGSFRKWYGNIQCAVNWYKDGRELRNLKSEGYKVGSTNHNLEFIFKPALVWTKITSGRPSFRVSDDGFLFDDASGLCPSVVSSNLKPILGVLNSKIIYSILEAINSTINLQPGNVGSIPISEKVLKNNVLVEKINSAIQISRQEWNSRETSWDFLQNELVQLNGQDVEETIDLYKLFWAERFWQLHQNEEALNKEFIQIYGLQEELTPDVALEDITILRDELDQKKLKELSAAYQSGWQLQDGTWELPQPMPRPQLPFDEPELIRQFVSYAVGLLMGRYSLDKEGLILANQGEGLADYIERVGKSEQELKVVPDSDAIIPVLEGEWFTDDIVTQFREVVRKIWGAQDLQRNLDFIEKALGKDLRAYFYKDFYTDHIKRYKKRPIYWMIASPSGAFQVLIYLHRYTPSTLSQVHNNYLRPFIDKLNNHLEHLNHLAVQGSEREKTKAGKEIAATEKTLIELQKFAREILHPMALDRIALDLDDGVLVNYNKLGSAVKAVVGLNDTKTKKKVRGFDWIDATQIKD